MRPRPNECLDRLLRPVSDGNKVTAATIGVSLPSLIQLEGGYVRSAVVILCPASR